MKFVVGPRVEFDLNGYVRIRAWDSEAGQDRFMYLQRLTLWAHGELSSPFASEDRRHAHHCNREKWDNRPTNLEPRDPESHGRHHRSEQESAH